MYLLTRLTSALVDLTAACHHANPHGAGHAAAVISDSLYRLHCTRRPDCPMARHPWKVFGSAALAAACRALANLYRLRGVRGLSGRSYDPEWLKVLVTEVVVYLDWHMGPEGDDGSLAGLDAPEPTEPAAGKKPCECEPSVN